MLACSRQALVLVLVASCHYLVQDIEAAPVAIGDARQFLPPMPGYIPVYIRNGDTPLEDINSDLAEAFRAYAAKHARLNQISGRSQNILPRGELEKTKNEDKLAEPTKLPASKGLEPTIKTVNDVEQTSQHIQKIQPNNKSQIKDSQ